MKLKTKIWLISLGIIVLLGVIGGIYGWVSKKNFESQEDQRNEFYSECDGNEKIFPQVCVEGKSPMSNDIQVGIFNKGHADCASALVDRNLVAKSLFKPSDEDMDNLLYDLKYFPILVVPTGGFAGLDSSETFKVKLAQYVEAGGVLIAFTQQHGDEFSCLPGGEVKGYGWTEDQSCWINAAYIETYRPCFAGQTKTTNLDVNVDGYFTNWPSSSTVLLKRTKNQMPCLLIYPYGRGYVIASTLFSDWGYGHNQTSKDEIVLIRDLISWAKEINKEILEFKPGQEGRLEVEVTNKTDKYSDKVILTLIDPDRNIIDSYTIETSIPPHQRTKVNFDSSLIPYSSSFGIWWIDYELQDNAGNIIQEQTEGERFSISNHLSSTQRRVDITSISSPTTSPPLKKEKNLVPKLVWEKEFDDEIVNFVVPPMPGIRKKDEFPIVAVETVKDLLFLNKKGEISRKIPTIGRVTIFSKNGKYLLLSEKQNFEFLWDIKSWRYLTQGGRELCKIDDVYGWIDISPDGERIVICRSVDEEKSGVWFYDKRGKVIREHSEIKYAQGSGLSSFSADGKYYAFSFYPQSDNKSEYSVILFDRKGRILWTKKFKDGINELFLFPHGEAIFIGCGDYFYLFNRDGQLVRQQDWWGDISPRGDFIVRRAKYSFALMDIFSGKEVNSFNLLEGKDASAIEVVSISPKSKVLTLWVKKPDENEMYIVSNKGEIIFQKKFKRYVTVTDYFKREINKVTVEFPSDNRCLIIMKEIKRLLIYELTF